MSEEDKIYKLPNALEKKGISLRCPICGGDHFSVSDGIREYVLPAMDKSREYSVNYDAGNPVYSIVCINCSYVMNFSIPVADGIVDIYAPDK